MKIDPSKITNANHEVNFEWADDAAAKTAGGSESTDQGKEKGSGFFSSDLVSRKRNLTPFPSP